MKKIKVLIIALISFVGLFVFSCSDGGNEPESPGNNKSELPEGGRTEPDTTIVDDEDTTIVAEPIVTEPLADYLRPVITPEKKWRYIERGCIGGNISCDRIVTVGRDTIIEGYNGNYVGGIFFIEDNGKISTLMDLAFWTRKETPIYKPTEIYRPYMRVDMNAPFGVIYEDSEVPCYVVGRGTVVVKGKTRRALKILVDIQSEYRFYPKFNYWIEGIGSIY